MPLAVLSLIVLTLCMGGIYLNNDYLATFIIFSSLIIQLIFFLIIRKKILIYYHFAITVVICIVIYERFAFDQFLIGFIIIALSNLLIHAYRIEIKELMIRKTKIRSTLSKEYRNLIEKYDMVKDLGNELGIKSVEIIDMYEIAKIMSLSIKYSGIMQILNRYLSENFYFTHCSVLFVNQVGDRFLIDKTHRFQMEDKTREVSGDHFGADLQNHFKVNQIDEEI